MSDIYGQLYCRRGNIGDDFQGIAASRHLPSRPQVFIDRERIEQYAGAEPTRVIMNGWFSHDRQAWPPAPPLKPIFVGFHVAENFKATVARHVDYLRPYQPIGVRDRATGLFLQSLGLRTETTYCLTLTFPTRDRAPAKGKVYFVDAENIVVPDALRVGSAKIRHMVPPLDYRATLPLAEQLLELYRETAELVVTTRLHAALPCLAMGIPVVFFGDPADPRTAIISDVGGKVHDARWHTRSRARLAIGHFTKNKIDWKPAPLDLSLVKERLTQAVVDRLSCESAQR